MTFESKLWLSQLLAPEKQFFSHPAAQGCFWEGWGQLEQCPQVMSLGGVLLLMVTRGKGRSAEPPRMGF